MQSNTPFTRLWISVVKNKALRRYLLAQLANRILTRGQSLYIAFHIYEVTGSAKALALGVIISLVIPSLVSLLGGLLVADRRFFRLYKTILRRQWRLAVITVVFAVLDAAGISHIWVYYLMIGGTSLLDSMSQPAESALFQVLTEQAGLPKTTRYAWTAMTQAAGGAGSLIIAFISGPFLIGLNAVFYILFIVYLHVIKPGLPGWRDLPLGTLEDRPMKVEPLLQYVKGWWRWRRESRPQEPLRYYIKMWWVLSHLRASVWSCAKRWRTLPRPRPPLRSYIREQRVWDYHRHPDYSPPHYSPERGSDSPSVWTQIRTRPFVWLPLLMALLAGIGSAGAIIQPLLAKEEFRNPALYPLISGLNFAGSLAAALGQASVADRGATLHRLFRAATLASVFAITIGLSRWLPLTLAAQFGESASMVTLYDTAFILVTESGKQVLMINAVWAETQALATAVGTLTTTWLVTFMKVTTVLLISGLCLLAGTVLGWTVFKYLIWEGKEATEALPVPNPQPVLSRELRLALDELVKIPAGTPVPDELLNTIFPIGLKRPRSTREKMAEVARSWWPVWVPVFAVFLILVASAIAVAIQNHESPLLMVLGAVMAPFAAGILIPKYLVKLAEKLAQR